MSKPKNTDEHEDFYETMPMAGSHYVYRDDTDDHLRDVHSDAQRSTAIVTLILVAIVAIALGLLFTRGLQIIGGSGATDTTSTGGLEP